MPLDNRFFHETGTWHKTRRKIKRPVLFGILGGFFLVCFVGITIFSITARYQNGGSLLEDETEGENAPITVTLEGKANFLFACNQGEEAAPIFVLVQADMDKQKFYICALPAELELQEEGSKKTLGGLYQSSSVAQVAEELEQMFELSIDRYLGMTDQGLKISMKELGSFPYRLDEKVSYQMGNVHIDIAQGELMVQGDNLLHLMNFSEYQGGRIQQYTKQGEVVGAMLEAYLTMDMLNKGERLVSRILNRSDSNITPLDFHETEKKIEGYIRLEEKEKPEILTVEGGFGEGETVFRMHEEDRAKVTRQFRKE